MTHLMKTAISVALDQVCVTASTSLTPCWSSSGDTPGNSAPLLGRVSSGELAWPESSCLFSSTVVVPTSTEELVALSESVFIR